MASKDTIDVTVEIVAKRKDGTLYARNLQEMPGIPKGGLRYIQKAVGDGLFTLPEVVEEVEA